MKNKFCRVFFLCAGVLTVTLSACGKKSEVVTSLPEEGLKTTVTLTMAPTLTPTTTPESTEEATEIPIAEDTYEKGIILSEFFASEWMNLRFTSQPGFEFGTRDGIEMYAKCGEDSTLEIYTEVLGEKEQNFSEEEYIQVLFEKMLDGYENAKIVQQSEVSTLSLSEDDFTWIWGLVDAGNGEVFYRDYIVRKKESRMIIISIRRSYAGSAVQTATNFIRCIGAYDDQPVYLPEEWLAPSPFEKGIFTEREYENEWLNLRIWLPEDAAMKEIESGVPDSVYAEMEWESGLPYVQFVVSYAYYQTAEEFLTGRMELLKEEAVSMKAEGFEFFPEEQIKTELLGGQEYLVMHSLIRRPEGTERYQEYYCRIQDNYLVYFTFICDKDSAEQLNQFKDLFALY